MNLDHDPPRGKSQAISRFGIKNFIDWYRDYLGGVDNIVFFPAMVGDAYTKVEEQMARLSEEVIPQLK